MGLPAELFGGRGADQVAESLRYCGRFSPCRWQSRADLCTPGRFLMEDGTVFQAYYFNDDTISKW